MNKIHLLSTMILLFMCSCFVTKLNDQNSPEVFDSNPSKRAVGIGYQCWFPPHDWKNVWGQPLLGFYNSSDPKVIKKHAQWIQDAGVDFLLIDWSNNVENIQGENLRRDLQQIEDATKILFDIYADLNVHPLISILLGIDHNPGNIANGKLQKKADQIHRTFVDNPRYAPLLFHHLGKPLLVVYTGTPCPWKNGIPPWNDERFTVRWMTGFLSSQPELVNEEGSSNFGYWSWWDRTPQAYSVFNGKPEAMNVCAAYNGENGWEAADAAGRRKGRTFREQWQRARETGVKIVLVNSWNEWVRNEEFSSEFSNDIEPSITLGMKYLDLMSEEIARFKSESE